MAHRRLLVVATSATLAMEGLGCSSTTNTNASQSGGSSGTSNATVHVGGTGAIDGVGGVVASGGAILGPGGMSSNGAGGAIAGSGAGSVSGGANTTGIAGKTATGGTSARVSMGGSIASGGNRVAGGALNGGGPTTSTVATAAGNVATGGKTATGGGTSGGSASCMAATFLSSLGKTSPLIGASMEDDTANLAPFDGRYLYLSGGYFDGTDPCSSCASGCTAGGDSCANSGSGCAWWGCWQWDQDPPGQYVASFVSTTGSATYNSQAHPQIPLFSYYEVLQASGVAEGAAEVSAINNQTFLHKYFADFRLVLQKIGASKALLHLEPDFWGYVEQSGSNPHVMPAPVTSANATDCGTAENSVAGFARCLISMTRKYAPNARIGLHASGWGTNLDVLGNTDAKFDVAGEAKKLANYLIELGAGDGDFIVADMSDRDAGFYQKQGRASFWDATNATLPNFHQAFTWAKAVSDTLGKPIIWWQIPVGNMSQNNTTNHYQDNRVDYLLTHMSEVVAANGAGLFFGAGEGQQTTPETDGGNLAAKVKAYAASPVAACP